MGGGHESICQGYIHIDRGHIGHGHMRPGHGYRYVTRGKQRRRFVCRTQQEKAGDGEEKACQPAFRLPYALHVS